MDKQDDEPKPGSIADTIKQAEDALYAGLIRNCELSIAYSLLAIAKTLQFQFGVPKDYVDGKK